MFLLTLGNYLSTPPSGRRTLPCANFMPFSPIVIKPSWTGNTPSKPVSKPACATTTSTSSCPRTWTASSPSISCAGTWRRPDGPRPSSVSHDSETLYLYDGVDTAKHALFLDLDVHFTPALHIGQHVIGNVEAPPRALLQPRPPLRRAQLRVQVSVRDVPPDAVGPLSEREGPSKPRGGGPALARRQRVRQRSKVQSERHGVGPKSPLSGRCPAALLARYGGRLLLPDPPPRTPTWWSGSVEKCAPTARKGRNGRTSRVSVVRVSRGRRVPPWGLRRSLRQGFRPRLPRRQALEANCVDGRTAARSNGTW